jgi:predicted O-linked N-acetylglucosamine transferase (SPINDLY family)
VTYLAYTGTTGLDAIDYRISDPYIDPPGGDESVYAERTIRLPVCYWCYPPPKSAPPVQAPPALASGRVTFGCRNNFAKVTEPTRAAWCRLLSQDQSSRLILHAPEGSPRDRLRDRFSSQGIDPDRLSFVGHVSQDRYFELYHQIDIALDTFPWNGGTTTCDANAPWMPQPGDRLAAQISGFPRRQR